MERLPEVDQLNRQLFVCHDVGGLEVKVGDAVLRQVSQTLSDHDSEVDLRLKG